MGTPLTQTIKVDVREIPFFIQFNFFKDRYLLTKKSNLLNFKQDLISETR